MSQQVKFLYGQDELSNMVALYESYFTDVESSLISQSQLREKGQMFLDWINDLLASKIRTMNQITERSIDIFKQISREQIQIHARIVELEHQCAQKNTVIENHLYTIKKIESKLTQHQNDLYKLKQENLELVEKIDRQEKSFKRETKEFKKTFRIIQENNESEKQIFDSIQLQYEYEKQQNQMYKEQIQALKEDMAVVKKQLDQSKRLLKASQNKLTWEIKSKFALQQTIKQQKQLIEKLLLQIQDLKDTIKNPYDGIQEDHLNEKDHDDIPIHAGSFIEKNILSEEMAFRQSFSSQIEMDEQFVRKNSLKRSFDDTNLNHDRAYNYDKSGSQQFQQVDFHIKKTQSVNQNPSIYQERKRSHDSSFCGDNHSMKNQETSRTNVDVHKSTKSPDSIFIKDMQKTPIVSSFDKSQSNKSERKKSPQIHQFQPHSPKRSKQDELQIITQKVQSEAPIAQPFRRYVPDLYFAHFLLTSQAVKIKEDCQEMLNVDVKQYYQEIIDQRIPMHIWDDWIREKLRKSVNMVGKSSNDTMSRMSLSSSKSRR